MPKVASVTYDNKGSAAAPGPGPVRQRQQGRRTPMVMGAVMLGGIITGKPPVNLQTPLPA
jgi:putative tricarboxylic transport membrane protein